MDSRDEPRAQNRDTDVSGRALVRQAANQVGPQESHVSRLSFKRMPLIAWPLGHMCMG
jgi:hypothetical protein